MPYINVDDFKLGMDVRKPAVSGIPGSLRLLQNGHITRGGIIERMKKFVPKFNLPTTTSESQATGSFAITGGTASVGNNQITSVTVNGVEVLGVAVDWATSDAATATAVAAQITSFLSSPNYTATATSNRVTITAGVGSGTAPNGWQIGASVAGDVTVSGDPYWSAETKTLLLFEGADASKTTTDSAKTPHTYTFANDPEIDTGQKKFGVSSCQFFDPPSAAGQNRVHTPDSADWKFAAGDFTVECWIRITPAGISTVNVLMSHWRTFEQGWHFNVTAAGNLAFQISTNGTNDITTVATGAGLFAADTWYHVACSREGNTWRLFVDGVLKATATDASSIWGPIRDFQVGSQQDAAANSMAGHIDEVRITKGAARYTTSFTKPTSTADLGNTINNARMEGGAASVGKTFGMHKQGGNLYVFGGFAEPSGIPAGVTYQRLAHKDTPDTTQIQKILDTDNFDGKIYAIAEYTDGAVYHFYDGSRVTAWDNISTAVSSNNTVASALKSKIDLHPDFTATVVTDTVTIEAAVAGTGFTISGTAQNFGSANDQVITLTQIVANDPGVGEILSTGTVSITGGTPNTAATGSFDVATGGAGDTITSMKSGDSSGTELLGATVNWTTSDANTASLLATEINANTNAGLAHGYSASAASATVTVTAPQANGADENTLSFTETVTGTVTIINKVAYTGGVTNALTALTVDGVSVITNRVNYAPEGSNSETATDLAAEINTTTSSPNYTASASGSVVTISAIAGTGAGPNGFVVAKTVVGDLTAGTTNMQGGAAGTGAAKEKWTAQIGGTFEAADIFTITLNGQDFVVQGAGSGTGKTIITFKQKLYTTVSSLLYFSALNSPHNWEPPAIGAGNLNFSNQDGGSETLEATGIYQGNLAVFSENVAQIEFVDVDEDLNAHLHTVRETGTRSHRSAIQFGNNDLFFLDELTGVRSFRARDSSNSPATDDVGSPIDEHLLAHISTITDQQMADAVGLIGPDGRYWLSLDTRIYVFSFFKNSKISAWSFYDPEIGNIVAMVRIRKKTYVRAGDVIYLYGGDDDATYPGLSETPIVVELPFLDLDKPAHQKTLEGFDIAGKNTWDVQMMINPDDTTVRSKEFSVSNTTYTDERKGGLGVRSSHFAPRLVCDQAGAAELHSLAVHYHLDEAA